MKKKIFKANSLRSKGTRALYYTASFLVSPLKEPGKKNIIPLGNTKVQKPKRSISVACRKCAQFGSFLPEANSCHENGECCSWSPLSNHCEMTDFSVEVAAGFHMEGSSRFLNNRPQELCQRMVSGVGLTRMTVYCWRQWHWRKTRVKEKNQSL